ncbi:MAG: VOC family protein, partial [Planctomycetes bacterium]|nr:VOC family protein [Planctomycetota bacterium]
MAPRLMNRINVICLGVRDIVKSRAFFLGLGFTTPNMEEKPDIVFFQNGGSKLELFPLDQLAADIDATNPPSAGGGGFPGFTITHTADSKEAVDAIFAAVESLG